MPCFAEAEVDSKKKTFHASEQDSERVNLLREEYQRQIAQINPSDLVFVDESGVNIAMTRLHGRSPRGQRAYGQRPAKRGKNVTMLGAMGLKGIVAALTYPGGTDGLAFLTYIREVLLPNLWSGCVVVMDNLSAHLVKGVREAIESVGARLIYLSPYSPEFSPIEHCWSQLKTFLRTRAARTYEDLDQAITEAFATVTLQDTLGWFAHCGLFI